MLEVFELSGVAGVEPHSFDFTPQTVSCPCVSTPSKALTLYTVCIQLKTQMINSAGSVPKKMMICCCLRKRIAVFPLGLYDSEVALNF